MNYMYSKIPRFFQSLKTLCNNNYATKMNVNILYYIQYTVDRSLFYYDTYVTCMCSIGNETYSKPIMLL